ncbi:hypothetical protein [Cohnella sp. CFH 77786]|uniref:hypothetical protein n=1 Tax=Cohnella sp. CFH 77786 TaxID=2662265 RepID=UPI001C60E422|nr:hypothetical protein [Cohnella sp. CFH 77786]
MSKTASLLFAVTSVLWMCLAAVSIGYNAWLAAAFGILACANIAAGFVWKARRNRR